MRLRPFFGSLRPERSRESNLPLGFRSILKHGNAHRIDPFLEHWRGVSTRRKSFLRPDFRFPHVEFDLVDLLRQIFVTD
jgi:hypothetical protein